MSWLSLGILSVPAIALTLVHLGFRAPRRRERGDPSAAGMRFREVTIPTVRDIPLRGWLVEPEDGGGDDAPTVVIIHGWGANMELMLPLAGPFRDAGFRVLLFDARNHGTSPRDGHSSMPKFAEDAEAALDWLKAAGLRGPRILAGHSIGAAAALLAASRRRDVAGVIAIAAFAHPARLMARGLRRLHLPGPLIRIILRYIEWVIGHDYDDIAPENVICRIRCPVLLAHGTADRVIPVSDMDRIARCRRENIRTLRVEGADHDSVDLLTANADRLVEFVRQAPSP